MPNFKYTCSKCGFTNNYLVSKTVAGAEAPKDCPNCEEKDCMKKQFSATGVSSDVIGGYDYEYGKKSWKRNKSPMEQASILAGNSNPY